MIYRRDVHQLCVITDEVLSRGRSHREVAERALDGGANFIQLRDKRLDDGAVLEVTRTLRRLTRDRGALFVINDRPEIAVQVDADGVHVGQADTPAAEARRIIGPDRSLGVSAHSVEEALAAEDAGADYLGVGPVYEARGSKPDTTAPRGLEIVRRIRRRCRCPIVAIGGIDRSNASGVIRAGADGVAVISAIVAADDIAAATRGLRIAVESAVGGGGDG